MEEGARLAPRIVVLALGAGTLGGPEALRALLDFAGRNPAGDIGICLFVIGVVTAQILGVALLVRFVRKTPGAHAAAGGGEAPRPRAPATDCLLARTTLVVSVGVAFLVAACLVVVSVGGGLMTSVRSVFPFAAASGFLLLLLLLSPPLLRVLHAAVSAPRRAAERFTNTARTVCLTALPIVSTYLLVAHFVGRGGRDAIPHFSVGSTSTYVGAVLLARFLRRTRTGAAPAPPAADTAARFARLITTTQATLLPVICFILACCLVLLLVGKHGGESEDGGGKDACSVRCLSARSFRG